MPIIIGNPTIRPHTAVSANAKVRFGNWPKEPIENELAPGKPSQFPIRPDQFPGKKKPADVNPFDGSQEPEMDNWTKGILKGTKA
jgi:hypothetical protein